MGRSSRGCLGCGMLVALFSASLAPRSHAAEIQQVRFFTFDKVEIHGTFYGSDKGAKAPCALLLHEVGGNSEKEGWSELAKKLVKEKGMAVLTFDFRGHGDSVNVDPDVFWKDRINVTLRGGNRGKKKDQIHYRDYRSPLEFATLVNDIAAAKNYLERRSDAGECNSSNLVIIGAESGAAIGALWLSSECFFNRTPTAFPAVTQPRYDVEDVACAVWLSIVSNLSHSGSRASIGLEKVLGPPVRDKVPMFFLYGEQDSRNATYCKRLADVVVRGAKKQIEATTGSAGVKDTKLAGRELLGKQLNTEDLIMRYITTVLDKRVPNARPKTEGDRVGVFRVPVEQILQQTGNLR